MKNKESVMKEYLTKLQDRLEELNEFVGVNRFGQGEQNTESLLEQIQCKIDKIVIEIGEYKTTE